MARSARREAAYIGLRRRRRRRANYTFYICRAFGAGVIILTYKL